MKKYVIERNIPGAGAMSKADLCAATDRSLEVLRNLGPEVQWLQSYVTQDKIFCVYFAKNPQIVREHAQQAGFPADNICEVVATIDPTTSETLR